MSRSPVIIILYKVYEGSLRGHSDSKKGMFFLAYLINIKEKGNIHICTLYNVVPKLIIQ